MSLSFVVTAIKVVSTWSTAAFGWNGILGDTYDPKARKLTRQGRIAVLGVIISAAIATVSLGFETYLTKKDRAVTDSLREMADGRQRELLQLADSLARQLQQSSDTARVMLGIQQEMAFQATRARFALAPRVVFWAEYRLDTDSLYENLPAIPELTAMREGNLGYSMGTLRRRLVRLFDSVAQTMAHPESISTSGNHVFPLRAIHQDDSTASWIFYDTLNHSLAFGRGNRAFGLPAGMLRTSSVDSVRLLDSNSINSIPALRRPGMVMTLSTRENDLYRTREANVVYFAYANQEMSKGYLGSPDSGQINVDVVLLDFVHRVMKYRVVVRRVITQRNDTKIVSLIDLPGSLLTLSSTLQANHRICATKMNDFELIYGEALEGVFLPANRFRTDTSFDCQFASRLQTSDIMNASTELARQFNGSLKPKR